MTGGSQVCEGDFVPAWPVYTFISPGVALLST